jgi:hypothetical protein
MRPAGRLFEAPELNISLFEPLKETAYPELNISLFEPLNETAYPEVKSKMFSAFVMKS